jgi:hypothetical protein
VKFPFVSRLLQVKAYGLDVSGDIFEDKSENAKDMNYKNQFGTQPNPQKDRKGPTKKETLNPEE